MYRNDIADGNAKLSRLQETLDDLEDQARDAKTAITTAQRQMDIQKTSTRAEVFRLRGAFLFFLPFISSILIRAFPHA